MEIRIADERTMPGVLALRFEVFVNEQNVPPEIELDENDARAIHVFAEEDGTVIGCGRAILSGTEAHIGRLAVKKSRRGEGVGASVCRFLMEQCRERGCTEIRLHSQLHAVGFYEKLGFRAEGEIFEEAGIGHRAMVRTEVTL